ncbi:hypothetical protein F4V43_17385 [Paenibacillus spiritus]|uniref:ATP synthase subunit I n=1 Tax=Paenibacillus spiritus TaxID=2496557 RepID=A0A5J5FW46_9BACL|nr:MULTISPECIES: ATP synthase subunit I [Paenibacillus]KAA8998025.1 hypothetical protein F4V43_17385 [Paenibacillus spiritus]
MDDSAKLTRLLTMSIAGIAVICLLVAELMPHRRTVFHGVVLGATVSCLNVLYMGFKIKQIANAAAGGGKRASLGFGVRIATSILAILLPLEYPHYFNEVAVCASLVAGQFTIFIVGFITVFNEDRTSRRERGEKHDT